MSNQKMTREELMLLHIYQINTSRIDTESLRKALNLSEKGLKQCLQLLFHGNFIRKIDDQCVQITEHGKNVAKTYQSTRKG
jgi:predicted transcriptional regulator